MFYDTYGPNVPQRFHCLLPQIVLAALVPAVGFVVAAPLPPLDLTKEIDESRPSLGDRVLRPVRVLEMLLYL